MSALKLKFKCQIDCLGSCSGFAKYVVTVSYKINGCTSDARAELVGSYADAKREATRLIKEGLFDYISL
jgi:hypothetical protein